MAMRHLDLATLERFAASRLERERIGEVRDHLLSCLRCRAHLLALPHGKEALARLGRPGEPPAETYEVAFDRATRSVVPRLRFFAEERSRAPELLAELERAQPTARQALLASPRFASAALATLLLDRSAELWSADPRQAGEMAVLALEVAGRLDPLLHGQALANDLAARAWASIGNVRRLSSDLAGAAAALEQAERLLDEGTGDLLERARLFDLQTSLLRAQRRLGPALLASRKAVGIYRRLGERHLEGRALINQATLLYVTGEPERTIPLLTRALARIDAAREPRLRFMVINNLFAGLTELGRFAEAEALLPQVHAAATAVGTRRDRVHVRWAEAVFDAARGRHAEAEAGFVAARDEFLALGSGSNAALVALGLARLYLAQGRAADTRALAAALHPIFAAQDISREALAALLLFQQAAERDAATVALVEDVARRIKEARERPEGMPA
jgi:tetratricopeptide (TPR) repeat protein